MSKERARRRAERERETAVRAAARAAEAERRERRTARRRALGRYLPGPRASRPRGVLAERRRQEVALLVLLLVALNALLWFAQESWGMRIGALLVSVLVAPVLHTLMFRRT